MNIRSKKHVSVPILGLGLCCLLVCCGSSPSGSGQGARPAQGQAPSQAARILANQVGYEPLAPKKAVIQGHPGDAFAAFTVRRYPGGDPVLTGTPVHAGPVAKWKDWDFWTVDWSAVTEEGTFVIECGSVRSHPILVRNNVLALSTPLRRRLLFQGPEIVGPLGQGRPADDVRGEARCRRRPRRLVRRDRRLRQAPLALVLLVLFQPSADLSHGLGPFPDAPGDRAGGRPGVQAIPQAPPRRGPLRRRLPRPDQGPERLVLHHRLGTRPGEEARRPAHHGQGRSATSS